MILSILPAAKTVKNILIFGGLLIIAVAIPVTTLALRQKQVYLSQAATQTCAEIASGYDYNLCSDLGPATNEHGCGEAGTSGENVCYYAINTATSTDCGGQFCRYYNLDRNCGSNKSECEERCTSGGCKEPSCYGTPVTSLPSCPGEPWEVCYQNKTYHCFSDNGVWGWHERVPHARGTLGPCNVASCHLYEFPAGQWGSGCCNPETGMLVAGSNCKGLSCGGGKACDGFGNCVGELPEDTTPPTISNVSASNITETTARISWETNENATSRVIYGLAERPQEATSTLEDKTYKRYHSVSLSNLTPGTDYKFSVQSKDAAGNLATSADSGFTTSGVAPAPTAEGPRCEGIRLYAEKKTGGLEQGTSSIYFNLEVAASSPTAGGFEFKVETFRPTGHTGITPPPTTTVTSYSGSVCSGEASCTWSTFDCKYFGCAWAGIPFPETCQCPDGTYQVTVYVRKALEETWIPNPWVTSAACSGSVYVGSTKGDEYDTLPEPPVISGVNVQVSGYTATVSWNTDIEATGRVRYDAKEAYRVPDGWIKHYGCRGWRYPKTEQLNLATEHQVTINMSPDVCSYCFFDDGWCFEITACNRTGECSAPETIEYSTSGGGGIVPATVSPPTPEQAQEVAELGGTLTVVDIGDYGALVSDYGKEEEALPTDFDGDGKVTILDYSQFVDIYQEWAGLEIPSE